ncbi:hypothetical protein TSUD_195960 [Trifolium subterraneum]|nr:hypothetical protein TSUD_195960 [Trifolium subterraneum]
MPLRQQGVPCTSGAKTKQIVASKSKAKVQRSRANPPTHSSITICTSHFSIGLNIKEEVEDHSRILSDLCQHRTRPPPSSTSSFVLP